MSHNTARKVCSALGVATVVFLVAAFAAGSVPVLQKAAVACLMLSAVGSFVIGHLFFRCPHCRGYLGRSGPDFCTHCGKYIGD